MAKAKKPVKKVSATKIKKAPAKKSGVIASTSTNPVLEDSSKPKRSLKKAQTLRQKAERAGEPRKPRHIKRAGSTAAKPFILLGRVLGKVLRPLRFLLSPFKIRPIRFVGRVFYKILLIGYFRNSWNELRQVKWPTARETTKLTIAVFTFAIIFTLLISVVDFGLDKVFKLLILE